MASRPTDADASELASAQSTDPVQEPLRALVRLLARAAVHDRVENDGSPIGDPRPERIKRPGARH